MSWNRRNLGDLTKIRTGKLDANASSEDGEYPFFTCAQQPLRISSYSYDCECALVAGNGDLNVKYYKGPQRLAKQFLRLQLALPCHEPPGAARSESSRLATVQPAVFPSHRHQGPMPSIPSSAKREVVNKHLQRLKAAKVRAWYRSVLKEPAVGVRSARYGAAVVRSKRTDRHSTTLATTRYGSVRQWTL